MKTRHALLSVIGLILSLCANSARAGNPHAFPAYYNGGIVLLTLNTHAQAPSHQQIDSKLAIPLYLGRGPRRQPCHFERPGSGRLQPLLAGHTLSP